jgi:FixJ family two-component response regulator
VTPLIVEGLTNKEIANRLCLSDGTVKNRLYRMTHNIGADDRLDIEQACRTQEFMPKFLAFSVQFPILESTHIAKSNLRRIRG